MSSAQKAVLLLIAIFLLGVAVGVFVSNFTITPR